MTESQKQVVITITQNGELAAIVYRAGKNGSRHLVFYKTTEMSEDDITGLLNNKYETKSNQTE